VNERDTLQAELKLFEQENAMLRGQLAEAWELNREMRAANWARYECWAELARLYRERHIDLARRTERTPDTPLH
jgi:hypothetical protein